MRTPSLAITALAVLMAGPAARADLANPDFRPVTPRMAFPGVERHADHVFLIHVRDKAYWGPSAEFEDRIIPIQNAAEFEPGFRNTIDTVTILAVPKADYQKLAADDRKSLSATSPGVKACAIPVPATSIGVDAPEPGVLRYDVSIADGQLRVKRVGADPRDSSSTVDPRGGRVWWGIALAASVTWLGLVAGRRLVRGAS